MNGYSNRDGNGRFCPVLGRTMTKEGCASERGSHIDCPPHCSNNPFGFANYEQMRRIQSRWFEKAIRRVKQMTHSLPRFPFGGPQTAALRELMEIQWLMSALLSHDSPATSSPMELWATDNLAALSNDERCLTRFHSNTRATVIEIQRRADQNKCVARDVFDPTIGEFTIFHPTLTKAPRFSRFLGWFTWFPHFVHPFGPFIELVPHLWFRWRDEVLHELHDRQNRNCQVTSQKFLRENFICSVRLLDELVREWDESKEPLDPGSHYASVYAVRASLPLIRARFESYPECPQFIAIPVHPTYGKCHGEYRYCIHGSTDELARFHAYIGREKDRLGERTIGMFSLYEKVLLFHCSCQPAFELGRRFLNENFFDQLKFEYDDILDVAKCLERQEPAFVLNPLPLALVDAPATRRTGRPRIIPGPSPRGLARANQDLKQLIQQNHDRTFANFIDQPHFFLDDRSPRDVARDERSRNELIDLMKIALYEIDTRNIQFQLDLNIDPILCELGLQELIENNEARQLNDEG